MFSYVFMKLLEARAASYDRGLSRISFGHSERVKRRIVAEQIVEGVRMLELGVGTGTLAILAAQHGDNVVGFDISAAMLSVARAKLREAGLESKIELYEMGVGRMDRFSDVSFDRVVATLVLSELTADERAYALRHSYRVLRSGGRLVVADEVRPQRLSRRLLYRLVRAPLAAVTWLGTHSTTRPIEQLDLLVHNAGLTIEQLEYSWCDSFAYLVACKE